MAQIDLKKEVLESIEGFVGNDETKYALSTTLLSKVGGKTKYVATDGRCLVIHEHESCVPAYNGSDGEDVKEFCLGYDDRRNIADLTKKKTRTNPKGGVGGLLVKDDDSAMSYFTIRSGRVCTIALEKTGDDYPDYRQVLPREQDYEPSKVGLTVGLVLRVFSALKKIHGADAVVTLKSAGTGAKPLVFEIEQDGSKSLVLIMPAVIA